MLVSAGSSGKKPLKEDRICHLLPGFVPMAGPMFCAYGGPNALRLRRAYCSAPRARASRVSFARFKSGFSAFSSPDRREAVARTCSSAASTCSG